jgi:AcrR family transcriptional regulator
MNDEPVTGGRPPSIWMRPERAARGPAPEHSRAEIARAAVTLADADGLAAVTMRAVAAAIGTAPASLYRYVTTRDELLELMADEVNGEFVFGPAGAAPPVAGLLALADQALDIYRRHPWLLAIAPGNGLPGPNALAYMEHVLAILAGTGLSGPAKLELIGLYGGTIRSFAQFEVDERRAGRDTTQWQQAAAVYLVQVAADGQHPNLAAALADSGAPPGAGDAAAPDEPLFDRALTRILTGLLPGSPGT